MLVRTDATKTTMLCLNFFRQKNHLGNFGSSLNIRYHSTVGDMILRLVDQSPVLCAALRASGSGVSSMLMERTEAESSEESVWDDTACESYPLDVMLGVKLFPFSCASTRLSFVDEFVIP